MTTILMLLLAQTVVDNNQVGDVAKEGMDVIRQFLRREKDRLLADQPKK